jgi:hypothetical protein
VLYLAMQEQLQKLAQGQVVEEAVGKVLLQVRKVKRGNRLWHALCCSSRHMALVYTTSPGALSQESQIPLALEALQSSTR